MKTGIFASGLFAAFLFTMAGSAQAAVIWDWDFVNPVQTATPTQTVSMAARITNDATSTGNLFTGSPFGVGFTFGNLGSMGSFGSGPYEFVFGTGSGVYSQLAAMNLAPGESLDFIFGTLTPKGVVAPGMYLSPDSRIFLADFGLRSGKTFQVNVGGVPVPEPASVALLLIGLLMVPFLVRNHRRQSMH